MYNSQYETLEDNLDNIERYATRLLDENMEGAVGGNLSSVLKNVQYYYRIKN